MTQKQIEKVNSLIDEKLVGFSQNYDTKISFLKDLSQKALEEASRVSVIKQPDVDLH